MLPALGGASQGAGIPQGSAPVERPGGMRAGQGNRVRVDEAEGALRPFLRVDEFQSQLRGGGDGLRGEAEDEEDERDQEQADVHVGSDYRDEYGARWE
ncbi:hypothetical protein LINGRAHAP2_LOCUS25545 [Linum grandiflorum]